MPITIIPCPHCNRDTTVIPDAVMPDGYTESTLVELLTKWYRTGRRNNGAMNAVNAIIDAHYPPFTGVHAVSQNDHDVIAAFTYMRNKYVYTPNNIPALIALFTR